MQFLILIYANEKIEAKMTPKEQQALMGAYMQYSKDMREAGVIREGEALQPSIKARTVTRRNGKTEKSSGPAVKNREALGGYYKIECKTMAEALKWAAKCPSAGYGSIEVRPVMVFS